MHPAQLQRLQRNTQYHRDMASYYQGEVRQLRRAARGPDPKSEEREGEKPVEDPPPEQPPQPQEPQEEPPPVVAQAMPDQYEIEAVEQLAATHAEAARQLEEVVTKALAPTAGQRLDEIRQVVPQRAGGAAPVTRQRAAQGTGAGVRQLPVRAVPGSGSRIH